MSRAQLYGYDAASGRTGSRGSGNLPPVHESRPVATPRGGGAAIEGADPRFRERRVESSRPGELLAQDASFVGHCRLARRIAGGGRSRPSIWRRRGG